MADIPRQDKPPPNGYQDIKFARNLPKRGPSGLVIMIGGVAVMAIGFAGVAYGNTQRREVRKEHLRARLSLLPLIQAEEDRRILRALKASEAMEALIMKDVPGWKVGESVYHTKKWVPPSIIQLGPFGRQLDSEEFTFSTKIP
ncbi:PREDICTED: NADH dehydrogenase [ubiquinone] 1 alpha subcomplex subunit 13-like [Amphimedon queenslandica]|uniref:NADH dehydrogenase [ubiquinone] 1 alpha subcomplex subunit 13 n=1 Tax=Amphimedon queenslandica TaxID=400682 RepID=A0A1X7VDI2_AMPQE|nr:PREDICTED: NADH dehydrogenase [ubiquinone] 1 alpha subcomplex subunit 13-like [Amphimedon queenslandica]|eukprot:XP_003384822.1 PREDICTED: NADH dehydrogenase [ubiquinone] 1 alpha subcomplex subunit 13-like [Amphimedon queenslandica]